MKKTINSWKKTCGVCPNKNARPPNQTRLRWSKAAEKPKLGMFSSVEILHQLHSSSSDAPHQLQCSHSPLP